MSSMSNHNPKNSLMTQEIFLNSSQASINKNQSYNTDLIFFFDTPIYCTNDYNICLKLTNISIPLSYYNINQYNNSLNFNIGNFTITQGNYNALQLRNELNNLLSGVGIIVSYSMTTMKFTFNRATAFQYLATSTTHTILGFNGAKNSTLVGGIQTIISDNVIDLSYTKNIFIEVQNISTFNLTSLTQGFTNIWKSLVVDKNQGSLLTYNNFDESSLKLKESFISYLEFKLLDDDGNLINLNGCHWNISIEVYFVFNGKETSMPLNNDEIKEKTTKDRKKISISY